MFLKPTTLAWALVAAAALSICQPATAGTIASVNITGFTAIPAEGPYFGQTINTANDGTTIRITSTTITCNQETPCSGSIALSFTGTGLSSSTPFMVTIDGTLSGGTPAAGALSLNVQSPSVAGSTVFVGTIPFSIPTGSFSKTIVPTQMFTVPGASDGSFYASGDLQLNLAPGQSLTLPSSFAMSFASQVPEPGTMAVTGLALVAALAALRRRATA